jgi:hypothetical protein
MSEPLVQVEGLTRRFDISKPWLNRVIERESRQFLTANADVGSVSTVAKRLRWWANRGRGNRPSPR